MKNCWKKIKILFRYTIAICNPLQLSYDTDSLPAFLAPMIWELVPNIKSFESLAAFKSATKPSHLGKIVHRLASYKNTNFSDWFRPSDRLRGILFSIYLYMQSYLTSNSLVSNKRVGYYVVVQKY